MPGAWLKDGPLDGRGVRWRSSGAALETLAFQVCYASQTKPWCKIHSWYDLVLPTCPRSGRVEYHLSKDEGGDDLVYHHRKGA